MNIIFILPQIKNSCNLEHSNIILRSICNKENTVDIIVLSEKSILESLYTDILSKVNVVYDPKLLTKPYDVVIGTEQETLKEFRQIYFSRKLPHILIPNTRDMNVIDPMFQVSDAIIITSEEIPPHLNFKGWSYQQEIRNNIDIQEKVNSKNVTRLLVYGDYHLHYELAFWLNSLAKVEITTIWLSKPPHQLYNSHIQSLFINDIDVEKLVEESSIVIGSGNIIEAAILNKIPAIVLGERGFGGLVSSENIDTLYKYKFSGRAGGAIREHIPIKLVIYSLEKANSISNSQLNETQRYIQEKNGELQNKLIKTIEEILKRDKELNNPLNCKLQLSPSFLLAKFSENKYVLTHLPSGRVFGHLGNEEAKIIQFFNKSKLVKNALEESSYKEEPEEFLSFIDMLLHNKIFVVQNDK